MEYTKKLLQSNCVFRIYGQAELDFIWVQPEGNYNLDFLPLEDCINECKRGLYQADFYELCIKLNDALNHFLKENPPLSSHASIIPSLKLSI